MSISCSFDPNTPDKQQFAISFICVSILQGLSIPPYSRWGILGELSSDQYKQAKDDAQKLAKLLARKGIVPPSSKPANDSFLSEDMLVFYKRINNFVVEMFPNDIQLRIKNRNHDNLVAESAEKEIAPAVHPSSPVRFFLSVLPWALCGLVLWGTWGGSAWITFLCLLLAWNVGRFGPPFLLVLLMKKAAT